jgi:hypothetical protein
VIGGIVLTAGIILGVKRSRRARVLNLPEIDIQLPEITSSSEETVYERPVTRSRTMAIKEL